MRIEQPTDLKPLQNESFRRNTRWDWAFLALALLVPVLMLGLQWFRQWNGQHVTSSQWIGALVFGLVLMGMIQAGTWFYLGMGGNPYAEFDGDRVRLGGPLGSTSFLPSQLVSCKIEPDENFPGLRRLSIFYHNVRFRLSQPNCWRMFVDDSAEAEEFCRVLEARAAADGAPLSSTGD
jgi:hypothetical protein